MSEEKTDPQATSEAPTDPAPPDTTNYFGVGMRDRKVVVLNPPGKGVKLSREAALNFAAWLVAIASTVEEFDIDETHAEFGRLLEAVTVS